jgi:AraC family transcriptional regulator of adaptative response/methylated-DNA-[protein]-cysteine methyltransferase
MGARFRQKGLNICSEEEAHRAMQTGVVESSEASKRTKLAKSVCDYIKDNPTSKITLASLGERFGVSPYHLQRIFVEVMGISPRKYLEECRLSLLKLHLARGEPVLNALRGTGYSSQSWLYEDSRIKLGMTPATYSNGGSGTVIMYDIGDCPLGRLLVAATDHGICSINVGKNDTELTETLLLEYPNARVVNTERVRPFVEGVKRHLEGQEIRLPLDVKGTDFQLRVWSALQRIPLGETRSYSEVAELIGEPRAVRAVANACASNPVPLLVPCHRVIRKDGSLGGYALGVPRKKALLARERTLV